MLLRNTYEIMAVTWIFCRSWYNETPPFTRSFSFSNIPRQYVEYYVMRDVANYYLASVLALFRYDLVRCRDSYKTGFTEVF